MLYIAIVCIFVDFFLFTCNKNLLSTKNKILHIVGFIHNAG